MRISDWSSDVCSSDLFTAGTVMTFQATEPNELFSQELRLASPTEGPINYVVGAYYLWNKWGVDQILDAVDPWPRTGSIRHFYEQTVQSSSGFAQVNANLTETIRLTTCGRYKAEENKESVFRDKITQV